MNKFRKNQWVWDKVSKSKAKIQKFENGDIVVSIKSNNEIVEVTRKPNEITYYRNKKINVNKKTFIVKVKKLHPEVEVPEYKTSGAAGFDIKAFIDEKIIVKPSERILIPTGLAFAIPYGYELQLRPRSGLALNHGITLINSPATIDSDYRGEVKVIIQNTGNEDFVIEKGDRIAQGVIAPAKKAKLIVVNELEETKRGSGGFGHTGVK